MVSIRLWLIDYMYHFLSNILFLGLLTVKANHKDWEDCVITSVTSIVTAVMIEANMVEIGADRVTEEINTIVSLVIVK